MNFGDLLQTLREDILHDRSDQIAGASDYLWSDASLKRFINEAYYRFAREALCIRDGSTSFVTVASQTNYQLDPSVIAVISAKIATDQADLARAGHAAFATYHTPDAYFFDPTSLSALPPGKPVAYSTDEYLGVTDDGAVSAVVARLYPAPSAAYAGATIQLRVVREPLTHLSDPLDEPELPRAHHLEMLDWAAYLALRIVDHDAGDPGRAQEFRTSFEDAARKARLLALRKMFSPLQHGFGRNGWSWQGHGYDG
jgi:hypothetical protein